MRSPTKEEHVLRGQRKGWVTSAMDKHNRVMLPDATRKHLTKNPQNTEYEDKRWQ